MDGCYATFTRLPVGDGFVVKAMSERPNWNSLRGIDVPVIANPLHPEDVGPGSSLPVCSAYTDDEIEALETWVSDSGSLLLIADHMPFPAAAAPLAHAFGIIMTNSFATDETCNDDEFLFQRTNHTLANHPITNGQNDAERVDYVRSFTSQAYWLVVPG